MRKCKFMCKSTRICFARVFVCMLHIGLPNGTPTREACDLQPAISCVWPVADPRLHGRAIGRKAVRNGRAAHHRCTSPWGSRNGTTRDGPRPTHGVNGKKVRERPTITASRDNTKQM